MINIQFTRRGWIFFLFKKKKQKNSNEAAQLFITFVQRRLFAQRQLAVAKKKSVDRKLVATQMHFLKKKRGHFTLNTSLGFL